jgi:FkbM family methyltransferase
VPQGVRRAHAVARALAERLPFVGSRRRRRATYQGPIPVVLRDARGFAFELVRPEEIEAFRRYQGHFEAGAIDFARAALRPGDTALDVGANLGAFTVAMARAVGEEGRVLAFEPFDIARRRLERTLELNDVTNVEIVAAAVTSQEGTATLVDYGPGYESWSTLAPREIETAEGTVRAQGRSEVKTTTLDAIAMERGIDRVVVTKIDVEGAEGLVIQGAERLLASGVLDVLLIEASDQTLEAAGSSVSALLDAMHDHQLDLFELGADSSLLPVEAVGRVDRLMQLVGLTERGRRRLREVGRL